jgi:hypothetical protein
VKKIITGLTESVSHVKVEKPLQKEQRSVLVQKAPKKNRKRVYLVQLEHTKTKRAKTLAPLAARGRLTTKRVRPLKILVRHARPGRFNMKRAKPLVTNAAKGRTKTQRVRTVVTIALRGRTKTRRVNLHAVMVVVA